jgi:magnesium and cobalt exporter, CNNM family
LSVPAGFGYKRPLVDIVWKILATLGLVALNAYFVATEFCAVTARRSRLETAAARSPLAAVALRVKRNLTQYLSATQLGVTISSLGLGAVMEPAFHGVIAPLLHLLHLGERASHVGALVIAFAIGTTLHIVIGEQVPKNWAIRVSDRSLPYLALPLVIFTYVFYPFIWLLSWITSALLRPVGIELTGEETGIPHTAAELRALLDEALQSGTIPKGQQKLLTSAFEFADLKVRQIMMPRTEVDYLTLSQPIGEVLRVVQKSAYTRYPLCDADIDHVIGLVHMKDLFTHLKLVPGKLKFIDERTPNGEAIAIPTGLPGSQVHVIGSGEIDLRGIKRDILFVPELMPVPRLLRQFQASHVHMAVVVDEYGATRGIVTLEDVIEEIVGEIEDEFDATPQKDFIPEGEGFRVRGRYPLHELRDRLELGEEVADGEVDTVGGYVIRELGRWPRVGDAVKAGHYTIRVTGVGAKQRRVDQVFITPDTQEAMRQDGPGTP